MINVPKAYEQDLINKYEQEDKAEELYFEELHRLEQILFELVDANFNQEEIDILQEYGYQITQL